MPLPTLEQVIDYLGERAAAGKPARLSPRSASMVERAVRAWLEERDKPDDMLYRIDRWDRAGSNIEMTLALLSDLTVAHGAFRAFCLLYPFDCLTLRHGAFLMLKQEWSDRYALDPATLAKMAAWRHRHRPVNGWRDRWGDEDADGVALPPAAWQHHAALARDCAAGNETGPAPREREPGPLLLPPPAVDAARRR
jgi:hypothetical protein